MAETAYIRCPSCGLEQMSMIQMSRASFESSTFSGNSQECTGCRFPVLLSNETVFFKDS